MGEVVDLDAPTYLDIPCERVLRKAAEAELTSCVVVGWEASGELYFASSGSYSPEILWLLELARKHLLEVTAEEAG